MGSVAAIVIAGGESRRFGADKLDLADADGRSLLDVTVAGAAHVADPIIVVGPERALSNDVTWVRESPPGGGPCAALIAGVAAVPAGITHVAVLAGDAPKGAAAVPSLLTVIDDGAVATVLDASGREQPLTAVYAVRHLREALQDFGDGANASVRQVLDVLRPRTVIALIDAWGACNDIDVPEDAARLGFSSEPH